MTDAPEQKAKKVLIVEDDAFLRSLEADKFEHLKTLGAELEYASNGEDALKAIREAPPAVMLLDLVMPGMGGFGLLETLKKENLMAATHIIVFSNLSNDADIKRAKDLGVSSYHVKANADMKEILDEIQTVLFKK